MNAQTVISVENLAKRYIIGHAVPYTTLRDTLSQGARRLWSRWGAAPAPDASREEFWALRDVSFSVNRGEVVGIIGRNGAGKSTLLKVLSRITEPTKGRVGLRGRVASLLEVGTGFHPELTGRENIFLNGAILGMMRAEITRKFDEIVAFAEVERFLDTPVKHYSSGMYVRLAFAVAAHLEPEILIIDEVLAVGDSAFQKKCLGKIGEVARGEGRTVLFVSHNMGVVANLCSRALLLDAGRVVRDGPANQVVSAHVQTNTQSAGAVEWPAADASVRSERLRLINARILVAGQMSGDVPIDQEAILDYTFEVRDGSGSVTSSIHLFDKQGVWVLCSGPASAELGPGLYRHQVKFPPNFFNDGLYTLSIILLTNVTQIQVHKRDAISFSVFETGVGREEYGGIIHGCVRPVLPWQTGPVPPAPLRA